MAYPKPMSELEREIGLLADRLRVAALAAEALNDRAGGSGMNGIGHLARHLESLCEAADELVNDVWDHAMNILTAAA